MEQFVDNFPYKDKTTVCTELEDQQYSKKPAYKNLQFCKSAWLGSLYIEYLVGN